MWHQISAIIICDMIRRIYSDPPETISRTMLTATGHFGQIDLGPPERWSGRSRCVLWHGSNIITNINMGWCVRCWGSLITTLRTRTCRVLPVDILHTSGGGGSTKVDPWSLRSAPGRVQNVQSQNVACAGPQRHPEASRTPRTPW